MSSSYLLLLEAEEELDAEEEEQRQALAEEQLVEKSYAKHRECLQYKDGLTALQYEGGGVVEVGGVSGVEGGVFS